MSTCMNTVSRPSRCYRVALRAERAGLRAECSDDSSVCMTAFVRDFAEAVARCLLARPRQPKLEIWLFP